MWPWRNQNSHRASGAHAAAASKRTCTTRPGRQEMGVGRAGRPGHASSVKVNRISDSDSDSDSGYQRNGTRHAACVDYSEGVLFGCSVDVFESSVPWSLIFQSGSC